MSLTNTTVTLRLFFTDVNECQTIPGVCQNGRCLNLQGGYRCQCQPGYRVSADGKRCIGKSDKICHQAWVNPSCWRNNFFLEIKYLKYTKVFLIQIDLQDTH
jgi:hypothetical protein